MGAAGAALKVAAPEAAIAGKVAGKAAGKARKPPVADPRVTHPGSEAARQRQAVEDVKAARKPEPAEESPGPSPSSSGETEESSGSGSGPFAGMQAPATGGGFVLGLMVWAVVRAYIGNPGQPSGGAGVKRLLAAKFLNKTS